MTEHPEHAANVALNALALRVARAILDGAHDFQAELAGRSLTFRVQRPEAGAWPDRGVEGISQESDGPWPAPVALECAWSTGRMQLKLELSYWKDRGRYAQLLSLRGWLPGARRELLWMTLPLSLADVEQGVATVTASFAPFRRADEGEGAPLTGAVRRLVEQAQLPLSGRSRIEVCRVNVLDSSISPTGLVAFERLAMLCVLKLPFFDRAGESLEGELPFEVHVPRTTESVSPPVHSSKKAAILPLPGGVRQYKQSMDLILQELRRGPLATANVDELMERRFNATGKTVRDTYLSVPISLGFCRFEEGQLTLTATGVEYLEDADALDLFERLHSTFIGMLEVLVLAESFGRSGKETVAALKSLLGVDWRSTVQVSFRRNWLLSLGLTDRGPEGDALTELGRSVLSNHADEVRAIRERLDESIDDVAEELVVEDAHEADATPGLDEAAPVPSDKPAAWGGDRVALQPYQVEQAARGLELDAQVIGRACAALFAGKHLLFVGPPGTGKTELARAIVGAAATEEYCSGGFMATASADWTTFDTIGGYALQRDGSLRFRPGALLRAAERWQWLIIDELNRADVDRAFGELMTVLSGQTSDTAYELDDGRAVRVGPDPSATHPLPHSFRVLATMNTWDKTSLFRLSYAVQRRFAIIHVDVLYQSALCAVVRLALRSWNG